MTEVIIIEDERLTAERLKNMVTACDEGINVMAVLQSVGQAKSWFRDNSPPDLVFLDIQLGDGNCFDLLQSIPQSPPVIFTTAYDQYAIKAFKFNSIDYLLKPIDESALADAINKFKARDQAIYETQDNGHKQLQEIITKEYKKRFLVKLGEQYQNIEVDQIGYFQYHQGTTYLVCQTGKKLPIDYSLDQLESLLNPMDFFRVNRKYLVSIASINQIHTYFNSRLLLNLMPESDQEVIVSRDRVASFKQWMDC